MFQMNNNGPSGKWYATTTITETFNCNVAMAFNTPILGDATEILIAPGGFKLVKGFKNDETWGVAGGSRIPIANGFLFVPPIEGGFDQIFVKDENRYWKWGVSKMGPVFFFVREN